MKSFILLCAAFLVFGADPVRAAPEYKFPREVTVNGVEFVHVTAGWFWYATESHAMETAGTPGNPFYKDAKVWLDGFYIAKFEARAQDFKRFMASNEVRHREQYAEAEGDGCTVRRRPEGEYYLVNPAQDLPATHLSWDLAVEFAHWMGFRLPTEGEWIKAARGSDRRLWPWGDEYPDDTFAGYNQSAFDCNAVAVDSYTNGKSPYGVYNMAGNVIEFVHDWYNDSWDKALKTGVRNPPLADHGAVPSPIPRPQRILRGGSWSSQANGLSNYRRTLHHPDGIFTGFGTRFALDELTVRSLLGTGAVNAVPH